MGLVLSFHNSSFLLSHLIFTTLPSERSLLAFCQHLIDLVLIVSELIYSLLLVFPCRIPERVEHFGFHGPQEFPILRRTEIEQDVAPGEQLFSLDAVFATKTA